MEVISKVQFFIFLGPRRPKILFKNDPEPCGVIFPKYQPIWITPDPIQAEFHFLETLIFIFYLQISNGNPIFDFLAGT